MMSEQLHRMGHMANHTTGSWATRNFKRLVQSGNLVPVEPVGTLTLAEKDFGIQTLRVDDGTEYVVSTGLPPGNYLIVKADDE